MGNKSLFVAYLLWLFGGFFGLHHFYLRRDYHALIWWMFFGGYFGIGWLRDLWRIPEYVKDANDDSEYMEKLAEQMQKHETPPTGTFRYFGKFIVADAFAYLVIGAIPEELIPQNCLPFLYALLAPLASAIGVYLVGNIGRQEGSLKTALLGAYLTSPLYFLMNSPIFFTSLTSSILFSNYSKKWRRTPRLHKSICQRLMFLSICGVIYLSLWCSWGYFNCTVTYQDQETIKCRDAAKHFFKSPIWREFISVVKQIWELIKIHGWKEVWKQIVDAFDPVGETNSLKVLGLNANATQQEITLRYRQLSREWHPDKQREPQLKEIAQEKFIEIQQAYEILSKIKSQRLAQNTRDRTEDSAPKEEL